MLFGVNTARGLRYIVLDGGLDLPTAKGMGIRCSLRQITSTFVSCTVTHNVCVGFGLRCFRPDWLTSHPVTCRRRSTPTTWPTAVSCVWTPRTPRWWKSGRSREAPTGCRWTGPVSWWSAVPDRRSWDDTAPTGSYWTAWVCRQTVYSRGTPFSCRRQTKSPYVTAEGNIMSTWLPVRQLCCERVLFSAASVCLYVCLCVRLSAQNLKIYWSEIDVTW